MSTYHLKRQIEKPVSSPLNDSTTDCFIKNNQLHIKTATDYYVYKYEMDCWFRRNETTMTDHFLGRYAEPSVTIDDECIVDKDYWSSIIVITEEK